jgi:CheY-like chemotaxis protein
VTPDSGIVLVVDDEPSVRKSTARLLRRAGLDVLEADSAAEALTYADQPVEVILTDVVMPNVNGIELAATARKVWPEARILLISAFTPTALARHRLVADGPGGDILQKPLEHGELVAAVTRALHSA